MKIYPFLLAVILLLAGSSCQKENTPDAVVNGSGETEDIETRSLFPQTYTIYGPTSLQPYGSGIYTIDMGAADDSGSNLRCEWSCNAGGITILSPHKIRLDVATANRVTLYVDIYQGQGSIQLGSASLVIYVNSSAGGGIGEPIPPEENPGPVPIN